MRHTMSTRRSQRGNALLYTLMALVITALMAATEIDQRIRAHQVELGQSEATVLEALRNAVNTAIAENMPALQRGEAISRTIDGVVHTIAPVPGPEVIWEPTIAQLVELRYLPPGWTTTRSQLNDAPYRVSFRRTPASCITVIQTCNIDGLITLTEPVIDSAGRVEGIMLGPLLRKLGVDGGVSLISDPNTVRGYGNSWTADNPLPGRPGVVALRVGTTSNALAPFVRIGDNRDPDLRGGLTVAGNVRADNVMSIVNDGAPTPTPCTRITAGVISLTCAGRLNTKTGVFTEGATTGNLGIGTTDPNTIDVSVGDLFVRGPAGGVVRFTGTGSIEASEDVRAGRDISAARALSAPKLQLTNPVAEGTPCTIGDVAALQDGGLATCPLGTYIAAVRYGTNKAACSSHGGRAMEASTGEELLCRNGQWAVASAFVSEMIPMGSMYVAHGDSVPMPPCRDTGAGPPEALLYLRAANEFIESAMQRDAAVDPRYARGLNGSHYVGGAWTVSLRNGQGIAILGNSAIAEFACRYR